jgi:hypothetical protein
MSALVNRTRASHGPEGTPESYGCGPDCEMSLYMTGANEGHCSPLSHHCNIMRCGTSHAGIGYWPMNGGNWNTQNFF